MQADTSPDAEAVRIAALSTMPGVERLRLAMELSEAVNALAAAGRYDRSRRTVSDGDLHAEGS